MTDILTADHARAINTVTWDKDRDVLHFYVYQADAALTSAISDTLPDDQDWDIVPAVRPIADIEGLIEKIAADPAALPSGVTFVSGTPSADGASMTIGVQADPTSALRSVPLPEQISGVPVEFVEEKPAISTTRIRNVAPLVTGGAMWGGTSGGDMGCTTGFPVFRNQDSQYNMLTADHCTDLQGEPWYWGNSSAHSVGDSTFQAPGDTDLELYTEPDSLSTWLFIGDNNDATNVAPIRGYAAAIGGNSVCYSGSRSGVVCSNVLESNDTFNCVGFLQCYWTRWSTQSAGTPAAGNGDSGGPVIIAVLRESDNTIGVYGVGVISMIPDPSGTTCTGDAGSSAQNGRKCSANVGFARLSRWTSAQFTHSLVYTTL